MERLPQIVEGLSGGLHNRNLREKKYSKILNNVNIRNERVISEALYHIG